MTERGVFPLTIPEWREAQIAGRALERLLSLVRTERQAAADKSNHNNAWIALASDDNIRRQWDVIRSSLTPNAPLPALYGVPFAAKDNIEAAGFPPATAGCPAFAAAKVKSRREAKASSKPDEQNNSNADDQDQDNMDDDDVDNDDDDDADAAVITRLKRAGAVLIGKTNLDQFATGLVGTRAPAFGAVGNAFDPSRISGGSSSGSGVVVSRGAVPFSLGTDTAGSGRVPAGLNNVVGLKPTRGLLSTRGVVPACRSLDCVSVFSLTTEDAATVLGVAEGWDPWWEEGEGDIFSRARPPKEEEEDKAWGPTRQGSAPVLGICDKPEWFDKDDDDDEYSPNNKVEAPLRRAAYEAALEQARRAGFELRPIDFSDLFALAELLYSGPWVAERYAALRDFIEKKKKKQQGDNDDDDDNNEQLNLSSLAAMDPVVRKIIVDGGGGGRYTAADLFEGTYRRQALEGRIREHLLVKRGLDGLLVPTTPTFPTMADVAADPVGQNARLGTYTNFVNFMDWSALAVPAGFARDGLPFGVTFISWAWQEPRLLEWGRKFLLLAEGGGERESRGGFGRRLGATDRVVSSSSSSSSSSSICNLASGDGFSPSTQLDYCRDDDDDDGETPRVQIAVVGAHLSGFPLNHHLTSRGAILVAETTTSDQYRLFDLGSSPPAVRKPGLKRVPKGSQDGVSIGLEVWSLPTVRFADFFATIPSPLGLGKVELSSGDWVIGFICEPVGLETDGVVDVSRYGGWRSYMAAATDNSSHVVVAPSSSYPPSTTALDTKKKTKTISKVLIANRGEIAVRIIRTLRAMGILSVAIHSLADASAQHVLDADEAVLLPGESVADTYLSLPAVMDAARSTACDAVIPGYGFLAENAEFAELVEADEGLTWIGPTPQQMRDMGLKHRARRIAEQAGVPTVAGSDLVADADAAVAAVEKQEGVVGGLGFPVMVKSTAGGGGIGLRVAEDEASLRAGFEAVRRLAAANFSDGGVFVERYVRRARHIEVQVVGDGLGRALAAAERDCSLQRRHQKVVEECPAAMVPSETRAAMRAAAVRLAESVKYRNVGTVEFIYDEERGDFCFLEMNTRLQVEHPVTEEVLGLDLVQTMVEAARGTLDLEAFEHQVLLQQHKEDDDDDAGDNKFAVEARIYAESPLQNFRPSPGKLLDVVFPQTNSNVRIDTWVRCGTELSSSYDPLIAKIIGIGATRAEAIAHLLDALAATTITGVETNIEYVSQVVSSSMFAEGSFHTRSLDLQDAFKFEPRTTVVEVLDPGTGVSSSSVSASPLTIQDYPARKGLWHLGVPPSGPMDMYSFRLANRMVGNRYSEKDDDNNDDDDDGDVNGQRSPDNASLECTGRGPTLRFHGDAVLCIAPYDEGLSILIDDQTITQPNRPFLVSTGQTLSVRSSAATLPRYRCYLAFGGGGIDVPLVYGSRSTFVLGGFGGHLGRGLHAGDLLRLSSGSEAYASTFKLKLQQREQLQPELPCLPPLRRNLPTTTHPPPPYQQALSESDPSDAASASEWHVSVLPGPHGAPNHFTAGGYAALFSRPWVVHYNSSRLGVRLQATTTTPGAAPAEAPEWARPSGGSAGLHPSNLHDSPYALGSVSFTGDEAVVLTADGPSLGGFVVFCTVIRADLWMFGQVKPGDRVWLVPVSREQSLAKWRALEASVEELQPLMDEPLPLPSSTGGGGGGGSHDIHVDVGWLAERGREECRLLEVDGVSCRQFGDNGFLLEFSSSSSRCPAIVDSQDQDYEGHDDDNGFDLGLTFRIAGLISQHAQSPIYGVDELVPGVRTLLVLVSNAVAFGFGEDGPRQRMLQDLRGRLLLQQQVGGDKLPSRRVRLPLAFDDNVSQAAVERYAATIRAEAPYLPRNVDFLQTLNFPSISSSSSPSPTSSEEQQQLRTLLESATFLVLGLGDVFLGSPCAVPMDPRHRLFGTKYNPPRSHTPKGSVGIGGQYMCIYAADSPGGYQLVGRTIPDIWRRAGENGGSGGSGGSSGAAAADACCLFRILDRITFYPVTEAQLDAAIRENRTQEMIQVISSSSPSDDRQEDDDDGMLSLSAYQDWIFQNRHDISSGAKKRAAVVRGAPFYDELLKKPVEAGPVAGLVGDGTGGDDASRPAALAEGEAVMASIPGRCFRVEAREGDRVKKGDAVAWVEANKMELEIRAPVSGVCAQVLANAGTIVGPTSVLMVIAPEGGR